MSMHGADPEALRRLARRFEQSSEQLDRLASSVANGIRVSAWAGPVRVRFSTAWDSQHSVRLKEAAGRLSEHAVQLRREADQQDAASASSGSGGVPCVPWGTGGSQAEIDWISTLEDLATIYFLTGGFGLAVLNELFGPKSGAHRARLLKFVQSSDWQKNAKLIRGVSRWFGTAGGFVTGGFAAYEAWENAEGESERRRWFETVTVGAFTTAGAVGGGAAGAIGGSFFGPAGTVAGSVGGGAAGGWLGEELGTYLVDSFDEDFALGLDAIQDPFTWQELHKSMTRSNPLVMSGGFWR